MFDLIANILSYFYDATSDYAVAIGMLTFVVLIIATPFTIQGTKSMLKMQILQPELKAIQEKYPKDKREEMNAELMEFYKENNINPVGGCLPMLIQIPVFLVLYRVILGLTRRATDVGSQFGSVVGSLEAGSSPEVIDLGRRNFNPAYLEDTTELFNDLSNANQMKSIGFDLARSASEVLSNDGLTASFPYLLLVLIVGGTGWFQHRMIRARQTGAAINPTQEMIMKFMPFFLPVFAFTLPAAIVIYFFVSNIYRIGQQVYITRSMYHGDDSLGAQVRATREEGGSGGNGKSGGGSPKGGGKGSGGKGGGGKGGSAKGGGKGGSAKGGGKGGGAKNAGNGSRSSSSKKKPKVAARSGAPGR
ncbi:MAG: YidC/Oxa1 family membrane protein insertase, partial [Acidimicrobiales bacterium]